MAPRSSKLRPVTEDAATLTTPDTSEEIRLTADRILVNVPDESERRSKAGLVIPASATTPMRRCLWSEVVLVGPETRNVKPGDRILFIPHTGLEVDIRGEIFLLLRERDVQAIASDHIDRQPGQYL
jgi:chaperonin GroES